MERIKIAVLLIITVLTACTGRARNGTIVINLDKPLSKGINLEEYCEKIEIIPLDETQGVLPRSKFCVFRKGFITQNCDLSNCQTAFFQYDFSMASLTSFKILFCRSFASCWAILVLGMHKNAIKCARPVLSGTQCAHFRGKTCMVSTTGYST